ncbi:MAG: NAD-dependent epimerase/dehydratase family protein [Bacteroidia bacterium]
MKKVIIIGASGMIGSLVLKHCLDSEEIGEVLSLVRRPSGIEHPKLSEIRLDDFSEYGQKGLNLNNIDAAFCCIGVYTGAVPKDVFRQITTDYPVAFARAVHEQSPDATFCLLSGAGADRSERSRMMFARDKGAAENRISDLGFEAFHTFRPGYIYPVEKRKEPNFGYRFYRFLYPLIRRIGTNSSITSTELAQAMFNVGLHGARKEELENRDILGYVQQ